MQCCVDFCSNSSGNVSTAAGKGRSMHEEVIFYRIPSKACRRAAWLKALGKQDCQLPDCAVVCSQHFLHDDVCETESGSRQLRPSAVPSTVLVCMICLDTDSKMIVMRKNDLREAYEKLTGRSLCDRGSLKVRHILCVQCAQRLRNFTRFREQSLRAHSVLRDLLEKNKPITIQHIKMIDRVIYQLNSDLVSVTIDPDHWDLYVQENCDATTHGDLAETVTVEDKKDDTVDSLWVPDDAELSDDSLILESKPNDISSKGSDSSVKEQEFTQDPLKFESPMKYNSQQDGGNDGNDCKYEAQETKPPLPPTTKESPHTSASPTTVSPPTARHSKNAVKTCARVAASTRRRKLIETNNSHQTANKRPKKTNPTTQSFICDTCQTEFKIRSHLTKHLNTHKEKLFSCDLCAFETKYKNSLRYHMRNHAGEKSFPCPICGFKFSTQSILNIHTRTHTGEKPFACETCQYRCGSKYRLFTHMSKHTGVRHFSCEFCDFRSSDKFKLKRHAIKHTGERIYACKLREYKSRNVRVEKTFKCKQCEFKAGNKVDLVAHVRTHPKDKPFSCQLCEYKCAEKYDYERHMRAHFR